MKTMCVRANGSIRRLNCINDSPAPSSVFSEKSIVISHCTPDRDDLFNGNLDIGDARSASIALKELKRNPVRRTDIAKPSRSKNGSQN